MASESHDRNDSSPKAASPWVHLAAFACFALVVFAVVTWIDVRASSNRKTALPQRTAPDPFRPDEETHEALIVLGGATDVCRTRRSDGSFYVTYGLTEAYPADDALKQISKRLEALGWRPLKEDWLNPGMPSSHVRGWTQCLDGTTNTIRQVHQWLAQWQDESGDIVVYALRYSYPQNGKPALQSLSVNGSWFPTESARTIRAETRKMH